MAPPRFTLAPRVLRQSLPWIALVLGGLAVFSLVLLGAERKAREHDLALMASLALHSAASGLDSGGDSAEVVLWYGLAVRCSPHDVVLRTALANALRAAPRLEGLLAPAGLPRGAASRMTMAALSPDGRWLAGVTQVDRDRGTTTRVDLWDARDGHPLASPLLAVEGASPAATAISLSFSNDGRALAVGSGDGTLRIYHPADGRLKVGPLRVGAVRSIRFDPSGKRLVVGLDDSATIHDAETGKALAGPMREGVGLDSVDFVADGARVVLYSSSQSAREFDASTGGALTASLSQGGAQTRVSPDGATLVTGQGGAVEVRDVATDRAIQTLPTERQRERRKSHRRYRGAFAFNADGTRLLTISERGGVQIWSPRDGALLVDLARTVTSVSYALFVPGRDAFLALSGAGDLLFADARTGGRLFSTSIGPSSEMHNKDMVRMMEQARIVTFSADGRHIAAIDLVSPMVHLWRWVDRVALPAARPLESAAFSEDGSALAVCGDDHAARVYEAGSGAPRTPPLRHADDVLEVRFVHGALVSVGRDGEVRRWRPADGALLSQASLGTRLDDARITSTG
jgi:WD40 repeat protein